MRILKIEFKRLFSYKLFYVTIIIGAILSISHFFVVYFSVDLEKLLNEGMLNSPSIIHSIWMGGGGFSYQGSLFFMLIPVLSTMAYVPSYQVDRKHGYRKNIIVRAGKMNYLLSKLLISFIAGGISAVTPLLINFILFLTSYPYIAPQLESTLFSIRDSSSFSNIYVNNVTVYYLILFGSIFIYAGVCATMGLLVASITNYYFLIVLTPQILLLFISSVLSSLEMINLDPSTLINLGLGEGNYGILVWEVLLVLIVSCILYLWNGKHDYE